MARPGIPLLARLVAGLLLVALAPLAISYYQIGVNHDALVEQVQRTHLITADNVADRADGWLFELRTAAIALAEHPQITAAPQSTTSQELLRGTLQARPDVAAVALFAADGEVLTLAQRRDSKAVIAPLLDPGDDSPVVFSGRGELSWVRIATTALGGNGRLILIASARRLTASLRSDTLGPDAHVALVDTAGRLLAGDPGVVEDLPHLIERATSSGKLSAISGKYRLPSGREAVIATRQLEAAPWLVISVQPAASALIANTRIRRAAWFATGGALLLAGLVSLAGWMGFIRPLHRVIEAQRALAGVSADDDVATSGNAIEQLETSFALLERRIRDREDLEEVFLDRFQVQRLVGKGSMGSVFKSWDPTLQRPVALKTVRLDRIGTNREELTAKLLHEAATHARFSHPNIVTVYDVAKKGTAAYIAMEYVDGTSLYTFLRRHGSLPVDQVAPLGLALARALAAAHEHDLVHHDVKPGNILLGADATIKVTDFGVSQITTMPRDKREIVGTAGYLAPECLTGEGYTQRSDLFALGIVLYEVLLGYNPIGGHNLREIIRRTIDFAPRPIRESRSDVDPELAMLIERLIAADPAKRPASADEVVTILADLVETKGYRWQPDPTSWPNRYEEVETARTIPLDSRPIGSTTGDIDSSRAAR